MRTEVEALVKELEIMKSEGITHVSIDSAGLDALERAAGGVTAPAAAATTPAAKQSAQSERKILEVRNKRNAGSSIFEKMMTEAAKPVIESKPAPKAAAKKKAAPSLLPPPPEVTLPEGTKQEQWDWLKAHVLGCETCSAQVKGGKQVVFGIGNLDADLFLCGEAPSVEEAAQGEPFVGPAGQLLGKILATGGWKLQDVYVGNIMNWRPDTGNGFGNRAPTDEELAFCLPYLKAQLEIVKPKVILALGKTAIKGLVYPEETVTMGQVHGKWHDFEGIPLMPTYHPSYLLHNNTNRAKRGVWEDVLMVMEKLGKPISERQRGFFL